MARQYASGFGVLIGLWTGVRGRSISTRLGRVATWDDVRRLALALPETSEGLSYGSAKPEETGD